MLKCKYSVTGRARVNSNGIRRLFTCRHFWDRKCRKMEQWAEELND